MIYKSHFSQLGVFMSVDQHSVSQQTRQAPALSVSHCSRSLAQETSTQCQYSGRQEKHGYARGEQDVGTGQKTSPGSVKVRSMALMLLAGSSLKRRED